MGMFSLGQFYEYGAGGLPKDVAEAVKWYRKAADLGETLAKSKLKTLHADQ